MKSSPELIRIFGATHVGPTALWSASVRLLVPTLPVNLSSRTLVFVCVGIALSRAAPWFRRGAVLAPFPFRVIQSSRFLSLGGATWIATRAQGVPRAGDNWRQLRGWSDEELPSTLTTTAHPGDPRVRFFVFLWYIWYERTAQTCTIRPNRALYPTSNFH